MQLSPIKNGGQIVVRHDAGEPVVMVDMFVTAGSGQGVPPVPGYVSRISG
jgi:hypothetical protein